ncbi:MAG: hypothetical protein LBR38_07770 [Synergistaceae bacterium]|jgi:hypothetical protein|nr:hypothetical protein [Synergistaceae bacterium]
MIEMMLERKDRRHELAEEVVNSDLPLVLYGSGDIAERAFGFLKGHGVAVQGVCVTDDYYRPHAEFHGMKVVPLSGLSRIGLKKFNVLLAFTMADSLLTRRFKTILDSGCVDRIFVLDAACTYDEPPARLDITYEYVLSHRDGFDETYFMLADQRSREAMVAFLNVRITHDCKYLLNCLSGEHYFPKDVISPAPWRVDANETFVDCGAYAGDTIIDFARETGRRWRHVFAFEPDAGNAAALRKTVSDKGFENVTVMPDAKIYFRLHGCSSYEHVLYAM